MVFEFIKKFTEEDIGKIVKIHKSYYLINEELSSVMEAIKEDVQSAGVYLGEDEKPSLALLQILASKTDKKIEVDEKGAFLFTCGRDLLGKAVRKTKIKKGLVLVQNFRGENLGYGKIIGDLREKDKIVVKNMIDNGDFLRREKN